MKRLLFIAVLIFLVACSETEEQFIESFNENSEELSVAKIESTEQTRTNEVGTFKILYESEDYTIESKYKDDKLTGYFMSILNTDYTKMSGKGYEASLIMAETLELDRDKFKEHIRKALESEEILKSSTYKENGYEIQISASEVSEEPTGMFIHFNKD